MSWIIADGEKMVEEQDGFDDRNEQRLQPELVCPLGNICVAGECPGPQNGSVVTGGAFAGRAAFDLDVYPVTWCGQTSPPEGLYTGPGHAADSPPELGPLSEAGEQG